MMDTNLYAELAKSIIEHQELIIGPVAVERASAVKGMTLDWSNKSVKITDDPMRLIDRLVEQYKTLFGQISVEVCKEATATLVAQLPADQRPKSLN